MDLPLESVTVPTSDVFVASWARAIEPKSVKRAMVAESRFIMVSQALLSV
jgi:hypothetical protein